MGRLPTGLLGENTLIWRSLMTTQSPCRSPNRRINSPGCRTPKTWWLWYNANHSNAGPSNQRTLLPIYYLCPVRSNHNRLHLPSSNRPKISHCLLLSKPYGPCCSRYSNPNPLGIYRSPNSYNRTRPYFLRPLLPG